MKVKILLMPLMIVIIVATSIWLVYPAYSNGSSGVRENYTKLKNEQKKLNELQSKSENTSSISAQISSLPEKDVLYTFIPAEMKEEDIVNGLINMASNAGVLLFDEKITQPSKEIIALEEVTPASNRVPISAEAIPTPLLPKTQKLKIEIKLAGSYEKIKDFLISIGKFNRSNDFEVLQISKDISGGADSSSDKSILMVSATVNFNVLRRAKLNETNTGSAIFDNPNLETKIISDIKNQSSINIFPLSVEQKGKINPFQP